TVPSFLMSKYPVTQAQYQKVMGVNPSHFKGDNRPVDSVTWHQAVEFCQRLTQQTGREYRLPSEAEWEYACRAGTTTPFHFGETIATDLANYGDNQGYTTEVGSFPPNDFGLYDMHGNVWEWCADYWHGNYEAAPTDGSGGQDRRILRGGSWCARPKHCRSAYRLDLDPRYGVFPTGFRVVQVKEV
ncbi:MAG TPA: formylglycine-generating enzyme family protein, partial [Coleofasciculaceae cyanobacterium]